MRTSRAIFNNLVDAAGRKKIAAALSVSESQVYKITEGERGIRPEELDGIYQIAGGNIDARESGIELLSRLGSFVGAKVVPLTTLREIEEILLSVKNGKSYRSVFENCPDCGKPLKVEGKTNGLFIYRCAFCRGVTTLNTQKGLTE